MRMVYVIRDNKGGSEESDVKTVFHMLDQGKLSYIGKKLRQSKGEVTETRYYSRANRPPASGEPCQKSCCAYIRESE